MKEKSKWHKSGFLPENEVRDFIIYSMSSKLNMNPLWVSLFMFDIDAWKYLNTISKAEPNDIFIKPSLVYALIAQFITTGSLGKESLTNMEFLNAV